MNTELTIQDIRELVAVEKSPRHFLRDGGEAFHSAIRQGLDPDCFMYMHSTAKRDYFKHIETREYVSQPYRNLQIGLNGPLAPALARGFRREGTNNQIEAQ